MRVLVTGGAGFLGSHIVDALAGRGDEVTVVDDLSTGERRLVPSSVRLLVVDVADHDRLLHATKKMTFDAVVHAASKTKVTVSVENPQAYRRVIVDGTRNVLDAARAAGAGTFVNFSTGGVMYGDCPTCATEDTSPNPGSPYPRFKLEAEAIVAGAADIRSVTFRPSNIYGPRQRDDLEGGVISIFIGAWKSGIKVFGDGSAERDYVYVTDVVAAAVRALDQPKTGLFNIGTGRATSVNTLVSMLTEVLGPPADVTRLPARLGEPQRTCLDASRAMREAIWRPLVDLRTGLTVTAASSLP